ncbi:MAG TPA: alpha/beta hydrolase domain-containing protein [Steroidobacteraceae bacterium]|jgi:hypothetical protein|nr:alpha/beta hydrolase domain-containing protein [Steroidobacteraceae bacterium]
MMRILSSFFRFCRPCGGPAFGALLAAAFLAGAALAAGVPVPQVRGPLPHPVQNGIRVWGGLGRFGYTVGEFLVSGRANVYRAVSMADARNMMDRDNTNDLARQASYTPLLRQPDVPYTTRILVYRPKDAAKFSGQVIVEISHPGGGGHQLVFGMVNGFFLAHGDAYVAIQHPLTFNGLKQADPARYGSLQAADPTQVWGMLAQVGALLRSDSPANPLAGYPVRNLFVTGYSYTGVATATFADYYHDTARLASGAPIFSGYLPFANGMYVRPLDVPVIRLNTQSDFNSFGGLANRREDSDSLHDRYRLYEVAGVSHVNSSPVPLPHAAPPRPVKLQESSGLPKFGHLTCLADIPHGSGKDTVPVNYAIAQAFLNMYRWVDAGVPPPRTPFISTRPDGTPEVDGNGNAIGGLRLPALMVPAATYGTGKGACFLLGYQVPFTASKMTALYGSHSAYVRDVERAAREDTARRLISGEAEKAIVAKARALHSF